MHGAPLRISPDSHTGFHWPLQTFCNWHPYELTVRCSCILQGLPYLRSHWISFHFERRGGPQDINGAPYTLQEIPYDFIVFPFVCKGGAPLRIHLCGCHALCTGFRCIPFRIAYGPICFLQGPPHSRIHFHGLHTFCKGDPLGFH